MEILTFLLGASFGLGIANFALLLDEIERDGLTVEHLVDAAHELGVFVFLFALLNVYKDL